MFLDVPRIVVLPVFNVSTALSEETAVAVFLCRHIKTEFLKFLLISGLHFLYCRTLGRIRRYLCPVVITGIFFAD